MERIKLRFGQAVGLKELIATLVVSGILLIVGTVVFAQVKGSMNIGLSDAANDTINNVEETAYNASIGAPQQSDLLMQIPVLSGNPKSVMIWESEPNVYLRYTRGRA